MTFTPPGTVNENASLSTAGAPFAGPAVLPPGTAFPQLSNSTSLGIGGVGTAVFFRNLGGPATISQIALLVGTAAGNICAGVYTSAGGRNPPSTRLATSGTLPCPASGYALVVLQAPAAVDQNSYFALASDSATPTFQTVGTAFAVSQMGVGLAYNQGSAMPLPPVAAISNAIFVGATIMQGF